MISSFCHDGGCVDVELAPDGSARVRDTKQPDGRRLHFSAQEWGAFLLGVKAGEFDQPTEETP
jgi:hypothetical protein